MLKSTVIGGIKMETVSVLDSCIINGEEREKSWRLSEKYQIIYSDI